MNQFELIFLLVAVFGIGLGAAEDNAVSEAVTSIMESKLALFGVTVVIAFIVGYMCFSKSCQLSLPKNTLSKLLSVVNLKNVPVCIKGTQWIKKTNFEICINPSERKSIFKTWLEALGLKQDDLTPEHEQKSRPMALTTHDGSSIYSKSETKPLASGSQISKPKTWFSTLRNLVSPLLGKPTMDPKYQKAAPSDHKPESVLIESPWRPANERSLRSVYLSDRSKDSSTKKSLEASWSKSVSLDSLNEPHKSKFDSFMNPSLVSAYKRLPNEHSSRSVDLSEVSKDSISAKKSLKSEWSKSTSLNSLLEQSKPKSGSLIEVPMKNTISELPSGPTQVQKTQNPDNWRPSNGPAKVGDQASMPVYGQHWNSIPRAAHFNPDKLGAYSNPDELGAYSNPDELGANSNPDSSRLKNCNKPIAITAVVCVTLTVLLMSGLFALLKANSEQIQQFGNMLVQLFK
jgi:hypothetical protein